MADPVSGASLPHFQEFDGPLDLLLDEVRRQKVAIERIAMAPMVARYLEYMRGAAGRNLNLNIDWVHMAATLIHWKSQSMLTPETDQGAVPDPIREALVLQLLVHRKEAAGELARRKSLEESRFSRVTEPQKSAGDSQEEQAFFSVWDMIQRARELARWAEEYRRDREEWGRTFDIEHEEITVEESARWLRMHLTDERKPLDGAQLLYGEPSAPHRACLFLAMLEMARDQQLIMSQETPFGPIWLNALNMTTVGTNNTLL